MVDFCYCRILKPLPLGSIQDYVVLKMETMTSHSILWESYDGKQNSRERKPASLKNHILVNVFLSHSELVLSGISLCCSVKPQVALLSRLCL